MRSNKICHARVDHFEMQTDQGVIALNYLDHFELYGTVGSILCRCELVSGVFCLCR
jgi:hypothetical protein